MYSLYEAGKLLLNNSLHRKNDTVSRHERFENLPMDVKQVLYIRYLNRGFRITFDSYCKQMKRSLVDPLTQEITEIH